MRTNLPLRKTVPVTFAHLILILLFSVCTSSLHATDFVVTNGNNTGAGSLRQALTDANGNATVPHTITFSNLSSGTYLLRMIGKDRSVKTEKFIVP